ncbi:MAG: xanthine dehydrogenase family protein molybdopterin-binding subunit [Burkholderiales bacterium]|nr:xanthine dehydrogenase family protein molybdopterin-binding subunit [Burkholderiales bacterium]
MRGRYKGRREDGRLLTGAGRYTADWDLPGQLYGAFLRSDRAHAEIVRLNVAPARAAAGIVAVLTGADTARAGYKSPPPLVKYPGRGGATIKVPQRDLLARDRVRFVGQEIALVVATSALAAHDAAELIEIEYRDLPAVADARDALVPGAPLLYDDVPGNLCFEFEYGDTAKTAAAFAAAAHVTRLTLDCQRMSGNPMEPKACLAAYDPASGVYDVYASSQGMSMMVAGLAGVTGIAADKIRAHALDVGGGFGIRSQAYSEYCVLMLAARTVGRPVKWVGSRSETFVSDHHGRAATIAGELALDRDGNFLGIRFEWTCNMGAYLSQAGPLINTMTPSQHPVNIYRIPAAYGLHRLTLTNTTPTTAYRGAARPNVVYIVERLVDEAARELGVDRIALRRRNLIPKEAFPYQTPTAQYDSGDPPGLLAEMLDNAEWASFEARRAEARQRGRLRGIGCAAFVEPAGAGGAPKEEVAIKFGASGEATLYVLAGPSGQGHETVFPEIVGDLLGVDPERITLRAGDPDGPALVGEGTIGSRSMMAHGGALAVAAREVIRKGADLAARALEAAAADIEFRAGRYHVKGTDLSTGIAELAEKFASAGEHPLDSRGEIPLPRAFPSGAHAAEVEVDPETGAIEVLRYVAVDDCGRVINHVLLDGQLQGGIAQGLGQVLGEHLRYDPASAQLLTGTFMDYYMPRADAIADVRLYDHSVPSPGNPLGVKGAGEAGTTGAVAALANAVIDALRPLGIHHLDFPYSPDRVWRAIREASGAATSGFR